jgi:hypothetical protein
MKMKTNQLEFNFDDKKDVDLYYIEQKIRCVLEDCYNRYVSKINNKYTRDTVSRDITEAISDISGIHEVSVKIDDNLNPTMTADRGEVYGAIKISIDDDTVKPRGFGFSFSTNEI